MMNIHDLLDEEEEELTPEVVAANASLPPPQVGSPEIDTREFISQYIKRKDSAEELGTKNRFNANMGQALSNLGNALAGVKGDTAFYDGLAKQADKPLDRLNSESDIVNKYMAQKYKLASNADKATEKVKRVEKLDKDKKEVFEYRKKRDLITDNNRKEDKNNSDTQDLSKRVSDEGLDVLEKVEKDIREKIDLDGGSDIPGFGQTAGFHDAVITDDGKNARQSVASLKNIVMKARAGTAVSAPEAKRMLEELGVGVDKTDDQLRSGIKSVVAQLKAKRIGIESGFKPEVVQSYNKRRGSGAVERTVVRKQKSKVTGKVKTTYSDGSEEISDG